MERQTHPDGGLEGLADRLLIRELIDRYSNLCTRKACEELPQLFIEDCIWRTRGANEREFIGRDAVIGAIKAVVHRYPLIVQMPHAPVILVDGDTAEATTIMHEFGRLDEATNAFTFAVYHDRMVRTEEGWKFAERTFIASYQESG